MTFDLGQVNVGSLKQALHQLATDYPFQDESQRNAFAYAVDNLDSAGDDPAAIAESRAQVVSSPVVSSAVDNSAQEISSLEEQLAAARAEIAQLQQAQNQTAAETANTQQAQ